uniref:Metalloendopeptidase n=1 Tax=Parastrongyloides trichosuri TaxID=131310 RepID=A0A0N4Z8E9_PARTI
MYYMVKFFIFILIYQLFLIVTVNCSDKDKAARAKKHGAFKQWKFRYSYVSTDKLYKWPKPLKYYVETGLNKKTITKALKEISLKTCIKFTEDKWFVPGPRGFNFMKSFFKCETKYYPYTHKEYYENEIIISPLCLSNKGTLQQFVAKILGLYDVHNRPDRDDHLNIYYKNIGPQYRHHFEKRNRTLFLGDTTFDYGSALHFNVDMYSNSRIPIVRPKKDYFKNMLGQQYELSFNDYKILNNYYCSKNCKKSKIKCKNNGYLNSNNCKSCICPNGYVGKRCENIQINKKECGNNTLVARKTTQNITIMKDITCVYYIQSPVKTKINLTIEEVETMYAKPCYQNMGLEIKFSKDKGATGLCLCGMYEKISLITDDNSALITYTGNSQASKATIKYHYFK